MTPINSLVGIPTVISEFRIWSAFKITDVDNSVDGSTFAASLELQENKKGTLKIMVYIRFFIVSIIYFEQTNLTDEQSD